MFKPGDKVKCDLTGDICEVLQYGTRDELAPLPGVKQIGCAVIAKDVNGKKWLLYEWEIEKV